MTVKSSGERTSSKTARRRAVSSGLHVGSGSAHPSCARRCTSRSFSTCPPPAPPSGRGGVPPQGFSAGPAPRRPLLLQRRGAKAFGTQTRAERLPRAVVEVARAQRHPAHPVNLLEAAREREGEARRHRFEQSRL